ncbi:uncharacterized protein TNCV_215041, partial [Trichonephila clavipes]
YLSNSGNPSRECPEKRLQRLENEHLQRSIQASIISKEEFERMAYNSEQAATSAYVFMIQSLLSPFKEVVHIMPVKKIDGEKLFAVVKKTIVELDATRGLLATDHVILNHGQVTRTTPELAPPLLTTTPHQREDVSALDRFNVYRCPTRRVFSGTGLEPVTKQATV